MARLNRSPYVDNRLEQIIMEQQKPPSERNPYRKQMLVLKCANPDCSMPEFHAKAPRLYCGAECKFHDKIARARFTNREPAVIREVLSDDIKRLQNQQRNRLKALQLQDEIAAVTLSNPVLTADERRQAYEEWKSKVMGKGKVLAFPSGHGPGV